MNSEHLHRFIDRKIEDMIRDKNLIGDIYLSLDHRIAVAKRSNMRPGYIECVEQYCTKRKADFREIYGNNEFSHLPVDKVFRLIKLRDKLRGWAPKPAYLT